MTVKYVPSGGSEYARMYVCVQSFYRILSIGIGENSKDQFDVDGIYSM